MSIDTQGERLCGSCRHFDADGSETAGFGICCAHPPQPINKGNWTAWLFPEVFETYWCGEWAPRRSPKQ